MMTLHILALFLCSFPRLNLVDLTNTHLNPRTDHGHQPIRMGTSPIKMDVSYKQLLCLYLFILAEYQPEEKVVIVLPFHGKERNYILRGFPIIYFLFHYYYHEC